ncbi:hypothetical protein RJ640_016352 [Escallonia rubra]|uniref:Methyltransferase type 11 domain-containing protein n=1 Tax=Escallonia rubra TaxID=112253 RepID=A0AA88RF42_9ASTE|nr:hypothetical protein RJ640_016352 [Escallonia rubra]
MDYKAVRWQILRGSLAKRLILKAFLFTLAMLVISFVRIANDVRTVEPRMLDLDFDECPLNFGSIPYLNFTGFFKPVSALAYPLLGLIMSPPCKESENLTMNVFKELMEKDLLDSGARALCVGEGSASAVSALGELGFSNAFGVERHPFFSLLQKRFVYELDFKDNYFDFAFSRALDKVSVPALLVLEIERVLRPGGTGAMLVDGPNYYSGSLVRSATPVSSFLKSSNVVHVCGIGSFTLVIFKKRFDGFGFFEHYRLPDECPSVANNRPYRKYIEPLVDEKAGELVNSSITKTFQPNYPIRPQAFDVYIVDHNTSILTSYLKPGITFVYHPGLVGDEPASNLVPDEYLIAPLDEGGFDFIRWFKETVGDGGFVVLMMNARVPELKILFELFETGAICRVDELFLRCSDSVDCGSAAAITLWGLCVIFLALLVSSCSTERNALNNKFREKNRIVKSYYNFPRNMNQMNLRATLAKKDWGSHQLGPTSLVKLEATANSSIGRSVGYSPIRAERMAKL